MKADDNGNRAWTVTLHVGQPRPPPTRPSPTATPTTEGTLLARNLVHLPPNVLGTLEFAEEAGKLGEARRRARTARREGHAQARHELAARRGAGLRTAAAPRHHALERRRRRTTAPLAFIGKGVVFDSGGISIKPGLGMEDMKGDMGGAAAVTGLMHALAARKAKVNAIGVIGLVENMPSGTADAAGRHPHRP